MTACTSDSGASARAATWKLQATSATPMPIAHHLEANRAAALRERVADVDVGGRDGAALLPEEGEVRHERAARARAAVRRKVSSRRYKGGGRRSARPWACFYFSGAFPSSFSVIVSWTGATNLARRRAPCIRRVTRVKQITRNESATLNHGSRYRPILFLDVDGVISLFGFPQGYGLAAGNAPFEQRPPGSLHNVNGVIHYISAACGPLLRRLAEEFELVWATGWEETANELSAPPAGAARDFRCLNFDGRVAAGTGPLEDRRDGGICGSPAVRLDRRPHRRELPRLGPTAPAPTLLVETASAWGMVEEHVESCSPGRTQRGLRRRQSDSRRS